jgi:RHH-type proline utilization regulon transcriptional repressor/proline dehydrogenase/delta 1-pyrroline-5-carboxylate dehydrogenase
VIAAGLRAGGRVNVSTAAALPASVSRWAESSAVVIAEEDASAWAARAARLAETGGGRIRLVGGVAATTAAATGGSPAVAVYSGPVLSAGRIELLPFLREQAVSISSHRFGTPRRHDIARLVR